MFIVYSKKETANTKPRYLIGSVTNMSLPKRIPKLVSTWPKSIERITGFHLMA